MADSPMKESDDLDLEELVSQHMLLFSPANELDDSFSLVQPHPFRYVPNLTTDAVLVENTVVENTSAQLE